MLDQRTVPRLIGVQSMFGLAAAFAVTVPMVAVIAGPRTGTVPAWLGAAIVALVGLAAIVTVYFWRIRPIAPGAVNDYAKTVGLRVAIAVLPAAAGLAFSFVTGSWTVPLLGILLAVPGLIATVPSPADFDRHVELWFEVGDMPKDGVWGTADPHGIPPWEDQDGGHGHGIGTHSHGLH